MVGASPSSSERVRDIGRYRVYDEIASGGMATVSFGRLLGPVGFSRTVAIKQLHAHFAKDPEFVSMFLDEARLAARIHHPNVVATLDVVATKSELVLVMDYVHGEALGRLLRAAADPIPLKITAAVISGALHGLHAAHEARSEHGLPLGIVHRDVSPQNILVGVDGVPRVLDFGVAKAANRLQTTQEGHLKGKIRYMSPEQVQGLEVNRQTDIYAMAIVLFEMLTGRALFPRAEPAAVVHEILQGTIPRPRDIVPGLPPALDAIVMRGLERNPNERFADAREMALALEEAIGLATQTQVGSWVQSLVRDTLASRAATVSAIESSSANEIARPKTPPTELIPAGPVSGPMLQPDLPIYVAPVQSSKTAFTVVAPARSGMRASTGALLGVFGVLALLGIGLVLFVLTRKHPPAPPTVAAVASAPEIRVIAATDPPAMVSAVPVVEPSGPEVAASVAPPSVAPTIAKRPVVPPPKPRPKDDEMARSRR